MIRDLRLLPAAGFSWLGCLVAVRLGGDAAGWVVVVALMVTFAAAMRLRRRPGGLHRAVTPGRAAATLVLMGVVVAVLSGWAAVRVEQRAAVVAPHLGTQVVALLTVTSEPRDLGQDRVLLSVRWQAVSGDGVWMPLTGSAGAVSAGDGSGVGSGVGTGIDAGLGAGVPVTLIATSDWQQVVVGSAVQARVQVSESDYGGDAALVIAEDAPVLVARPPPLAAAIAALRAGLVQACEHLNGAGRGLVPGIALGDDRQLPATLDADLRTVSLTHVTAVSGAHVAMVVGLVLAAAARLRPRWRAVLGALVLGGLVLLVHPSASVVRAAAMGAVVLAGLVLGRPRSALPALWTSVIVLLAIDPWLSVSFGFVLSVLATAGLLLAVAPLAAVLSRYLARPLAMLIAIPLAAQVACLPALALLQPQAPVYGVLANVLAAPAVPLVTVLGLTATLVHPLLPGVAELLATVAAVGADWIAVVATWCARLPLALVPWWAAVLVSAIAVLLAWGAVRVRRRRGAGAGTAGVAGSGAGDGGATEAPVSPAR